MRILISQNVEGIIYIFLNFKHLCYFRYMHLHANNNAVLIFLRAARILPLRHIFSFDDDDIATLIIFDIFGLLYHAFDITFRLIFIMWRRYLHLLLFHWYIFDAVIEHFSIQILLASPHTIPSVISILLVSFEITFEAFAYFLLYLRYFLCCCRLPYARHVIAQNATINAKVLSQWYAL